MNILITSAGRRVKIVRYFQNEIKEVSGSVITTDLDPNAPALFYSDYAYVVPNIRSETYIDELMAICKKHKVSAVISLIDPELSILAEQKHFFAEEGISVITSSLRMIELSFDKLRTHHFLRENQLPSVPTFQSKEEIIEQLSRGNYNFPFIAKPRTGSASIGLTIIEDLNTLHLVGDQHEDLIFQPHYKEKEYGVDAYIDLESGKLVNIFIKEKLRMRSGETDKSISVHNVQIEKMICNLLLQSDFRGPLDIDVFEYKGAYYISEINPRFGGGYPHAYECGVNFPKYLMNNLQRICNEEYEGFTYEAGKVMMKHDDVLVC